MKTLKQVTLLLLLSLSMTVDASLVGTFIKLLTDSSRQADRAALIGRHVADGDASRYSNNISNAIFGLSGGTNRNPSAEQVLGFINGSNIPQTKKDQIIAILSKPEGEISAEDLDVVTIELQRAAHSIDPNGVILRTCETACVATGSRLSDDVFVVENQAMRGVLRRYSNESSQRSQIQRLLRRSGMGRMNASSSFITSNGADSQYMLLFLEALKDGSNFPTDTVNFAKAIKEFAKKSDGSYDLFDAGNAQRLYRLVVELDSADHATYARYFSEIAGTCASQYPKKDCFFTEMKKVAKRENPDLADSQIDEMISGMRAKGCFFD